MVNATTADIDIRSLLNMVWNKRLFVLVTFLVGFLMTSWVVSLMGTRYTAQSLVLVKNESTDTQIEELISLVKSSPFNVAFILTELEVFKSRTLITRVVKRLDLMNDPEFNPKISSSGQSVDIGITQKQQSTFKNLYVNGTEMKTLKAETVDDDVSATVSRFLERLTAISVPGSLAIKVSFSSENPQKAAFITNTLVDEYLKQRLEEKFETQNRLTDWLNKRLVELRKQVSEADKKAEQFRAENNLLAGKRGMISSEQISALNAELVDAQTRYLDAKVRYQQAARLTGDVDNTSAMSKVVNAGLMKELELQQIRLKSEISELSNRYGPKHPAMANKKTELVELQAKINEELAKAKKTLKSDLNIAKARVDEIQKDIDSFAVEVNDSGDALITLRELEREAEASKMVLKTFLETYKKTLGRDDLQDSGAHVLSYANVPLEPSSPNKALILSLGTFVSFLTGLLVALFAEKLDTRLRTIEDLEVITGLTCSGAIPYTRGLSKNSLTKYVHTNPSSPLTEAVRSLYVELEKTQERAKVITFISSDKNEGKTTLSALMAAVMVKAGRKVILIDANLREPGISDALKKSAGSTLVEYLTGRKDLQDVITKDSETGMDVIYGQAIPNSAFDVLSSKNMKAMILALKEKYDHVIIDTPPSSDVSDAKVLARLADQNVFIVNWNKAANETIEKTMKYFQDIPRSAITMTLNNVRKKL